MFHAMLALVQDASEEALSANILTTLATYIGLAGGVAFLVEAIKKFSGGWLKGKERYIAFLLGPGGGALVKWLTDFYADVAWGPHIVLCIVGVGAFGAGFIHDTVLKRLVEMLAPGRVGKKDGEE